MPKLTKRLIDAFATSAPEVFLWDSLVLGFGVQQKGVFLGGRRLGPATARRSLAGASVGARSHPTGS